VEAKAHTAELRSHCAATSPGSVKLIDRALAETKSFLGATGGDWTRQYHQYCNRLATLYILNKRMCVPARLLFIYFLGDRGECYGRNGSTFDETATPAKDFDCPQTKEGWNEPIQEMNKHLGLPASHKLDDRIHNLFLDVRGR
jgi:hypothetical protein